MAVSTASRISQNLSSCRNTDSLLAQLREQFDQGETTAKLPFTSIKNLGDDGLRHLVQRVEADLLSKFTVEINMVANNARFTPVVPSSEASSPTSVTSTTTTTSSKPIITSKKVRRPPNAFIIYRQDWHARTVAKHPGVHNTKISRIIGDQWREESQSVKDDYAQKAAYLKQQHLINNPGYHYQPRKPHEKKRRMTKRKIAALAAQKNSSTTTAASSEDAIQAARPNALDVAQMPGPPLQISHSGVMTFVAAPDPNNTLSTVANTFNNLNTQVLGQVTAVSPYLVETMATGRPMADEALVMDDFDFTTLAVDLANANAAQTTTDEYHLPGAETSGLELGPFNPDTTVPSSDIQGSDALSSLSMYYAQGMAEYDRQTDLAHADDMGTLFDFDAFGDHVSTGHQVAEHDDAEDAINQVEANYEMPNIDGNFDMDDAALTQILGVPCRDGEIVEQDFDDDPVWGPSLRHLAAMAEAGAYPSAGSS